MKEMEILARPARPASCFQCLFVFVLIEIILGGVLTMMAITFLVFIAFEKESFLHVFGFLEGILAVIAGSVGLLPIRVKHPKMTRAWLLTHCIFAATTILILLIDVSFVTPPIVKTILSADPNTNQLIHGQSYISHHTMASLYLATSVIHVSLLLSLSVSAIIGLVNLQFCCGQTGSYDTGSTDITDAERL